LQQKSDTFQCKPGQKPRNKGFQENLAVAAADIRPVFHPRPSRQSAKLNTKRLEALGVDMSSKEEKKPAEDKKTAEPKAEKGPPDEISEARKKRKLVLVLGIGGVIASAAAAGGFFVYKTFVQKGTSLAAKAPAGAATPATTDDKKKDEAHAEKKDDAHAEKKDDAHAKKKDDAHAEKKDDAHAEKKDAAASDKKDAAAGDKKDAAAGDKKDAAAGDKKDAAAGDKKDAAASDKKDAAAGDKKDEKSDLKMFKSDESFGETFALPKMDLNLGNPLENRYLRIAVSIEYTGGKTQQDELKRREPQLKDLIISSVSSRTRLELLTEKGKEKLRRELINKINETFERPVKTIYFTDFLVE
jgi:flagellar FliL protein